MTEDDGYTMQYGSVADVQVLGPGPQTSPLPEHALAAFRAAQAEWDAATAAHDSSAQNDAAGS